MDDRYEVYWLKKGTILNEKYKILDVISEGGFGIVYLGHDITLDMDVAVKEFFPRRFAMRDSSSDVIHLYKGESEESFNEGMERFLEEARVLARFHDLRNVVMVRDFFYQNNTAYLINEHIDARTIHYYVRKNGAIPPDEVLAMMEPILESLECVHETGLLHRDISPDNIILRENGEAVLIDFGAARIANVQEDLTITVFFKRGYSAEEQYASNGKQGTFTDVYAICATMYFMLTGTQPEESVQRHIRDNVVPLSKLKEIDMPIYQKNAIMKGMSVLVENRYQTVGELREALYGKRRFYQSFYGKLAVGAACLCVFAVGMWSWRSYAASHVSGTTDYVVSVSGESVKESGGGELSNGVSGGGNQLYTVSGGSIEEPDQVTSRTAVTEPAQTPAYEYEIPDVTGMKHKTAKQWIRRLAEPSLKIVVKKVFSKKIEKGHVIRQSIKSGKYPAGKYKKLVLTVSRGEKPVKATPSPVPTAAPTKISPTRTPSRESEDKKNQGSDGEFAGELPW